MELFGFPPFLRIDISLTNPTCRFTCVLSAVDGWVTVPFHSTRGDEHVQELLQKSPVMVCGVEKCSPLLKFSSSPLKNAGWKTRLCCWEGNLSGAMLNFGGYVVVLWAITYGWPAVKSCGFGADTSSLVANNSLHHVCFFGEGNS